MFVRDPSGSPIRSRTVLASHGLSVLDAAIAALLLLALGTLAASRPAESQSAEARATARIRVPAVAKVEPVGSVRVSFPEPAELDPSIAGTERRVEARGAIRVRCASNASHELRVRRVGADLPPGARVQWSADGGETWNDLRPDWRAVRTGLPPGDHRDCVALRHRVLVPAGEREVGSVALSLAVEPLAADPSRRPAVTRR